MYTYETRRKLTVAWVEGVRERGGHLSEQEKEMLPDIYAYGIPREACDTMRRLLTDGKYPSLSRLYQKEHPALVDVCVPKGRQGEFYYALDQMNQYQMTAGWHRRSLRSESYAPFVDRSVRLLRAYSRMEFYGVALSDLLTGNVDAELFDHARSDYLPYAEMLAAQIDMGVEGAAQAVKDLLLGEGNTLMVSHELIRGVVMCQDKELYALLGKFLLAARLQEGARQAVCETMDEGRPEAFLHLFSVIEEHHLIRYSSVKRAVATWIGIFNEMSVDRISEKLVGLMGRCLRDAAFVKEQLATEDAVGISCALWALGFFCVQDAVDAVVHLARHGTRHQKMTASYFCRSLQEGRLKMQAAKEIILRHPEDMELVACFFPSFMDGADATFYQLTKDDGSKKEATPPKKMDATELFDSKEEAREAYDTLKGILDRIPKKGFVKSPCIFPWHQVEITQSEAVTRMCLIAWMLQDDALLDEAARLIPLIGQGGGYYGTSRAAVARTLLYRPKTAARKEALFALLHNAEQSANEAAHLLVDSMELSAEDFLLIEKNLKYKKGRAGTLKILQRQDGESLAFCIGRLLSAKSEECHMGGLDLALWLKKEGKESFAKAIPFLKALKSPTGREQVLLDELLSEESEAQDILRTPGYGLYDVDKAWVLPEVKAGCADASELFACGEGACIGLIQGLDRLVGENKDRTYRDSWDDELLLGDKLRTVKKKNGGSDDTPLDAYPFRELWEEFYETKVNDPNLLLEAYLYLQCWWRAGDYGKNKNLYKEVFGKGAKQAPPFEKLDILLSYRDQVNTILRALFLQYVPDSFKARFALAAMKKFLSVLNPSNDLIFYDEKWFGKTETYTKRAVELPIFQQLCDWLPGLEDEDWGSAFALKFQLQQHYWEQKGRERSRYAYDSARAYLEASDYVKCCLAGVWDKDLFYKAIVTFHDLGRLLEPVSSVEQKGAVPYRRVRGIAFFFGRGTIQPVDGRFRFDEMRGEMPQMAFAHEIYEELLPVTLAVELKRGEQATPFSRHICCIQVIYGIDYMIQILTALGQDPLQRGYSCYSSDGDRRMALSHLLKVCMPKPGETALDLKAALKGTDITKKRLVELAMYAQQWIPMVEEYLKLPGFASACYYFMAHTSDCMDDETASIVARYTPLSPEELGDGAFDVSWFFEAYGKLGEKNFALLYGAAKYSSSGTAHGRARKYADAALGKVSREALEGEIDAKRNKDLLMSLGLLPLPKAKKAREDELFARYSYIQKFKKESRQFGAQRRASEGRAAELALRNLSVNAGFTDVTRLTLRMEHKLAQSAAPYFTWRAIEEIEVRVSVDAYGKSAIECRKGQKPLKSIPAKYKKHEAVLEYQETHKRLKEQYRRTKQMLEQAMEDGTEFEAWELLELQKNPVARPIAAPLVMLFCGKKEGMGFLTKEGMTDSLGNAIPVKPSDKVRIAHPYDLYREGHWHAYQKLLFERQEKQPFKQVFRELYVKLEEEMEKEESRLFSGNQIQPQKTVGALRARRWVADYEDGLQKVYYNEDIVARIYAMADWFSPSDVEAPTLEWVAFLNRKTGKPMKIKEIPDVIYSEVMRDVDLAVSVAHAGGVDPETSHSTVEMRRAIVACSMELFGLTNVTLKDSHAIIDGKLGQYSVHLGSGVVHQAGNAMLFVIPVHSQHRGRIFLPFVDDDPKTAEIVSKVLLFAQDDTIKDPKILSQIR